MKKTMFSLLLITIMLSMFAASAYGTHDTDNTNIFRGEPTFSANSAGRILDVPKAKADADVENKDKKDDSQKTAKPDASMLDSIKADIIYPKDGSYLDTVKECYVKAPKGAGIYLFSRTPNLENYMDYCTAVIPDGTFVEVIAEELGAACVIIDDVQVGWLNADYLIETPCREGYRVICEDMYYVPEEFRGRTDIVQFINYNNVAAVLSADGTITVISDDELYKKAEEWTAIKEFVILKNGIAALRYDGTLLYSLEEWVGKKLLDDFISRHSLIDISENFTFGTLVLVSDDGYVFTLFDFMHYPMEIKIPGAVQAYSHALCYVLTDDGTVHVYQPRLHQEDNILDFGIAGKGVKKLAVSESWGEGDGAMLMDDGTVQIIETTDEPGERGLPEFYGVPLEGVKDIVDIVEMGKQIVGVDSHGNLCFPKEQYSSEDEMKAFADWKNIKALGTAGEYDYNGILYGLY